MKVYVEVTFTKSHIFEIPDGTEEKMIEAAEAANDSHDWGTEEPEWSSTDFFRPATDDNTKFTDWFDLS